MESDSKQELRDIMDEVQKNRGWWDRHAGGIAAALLLAFLVFIGNWALDMNNQMVQINTELQQVNKMLVKMENVEARVTRIEATRFTDADAQEIRQRLRELEKQQQRLSDIVINKGD